MRNIFRAIAVISLFTAFGSNRKAMGGGRTPMAYLKLLLSITEINREKYKI
jgi:hypothetical protein